MRVVVRDEDRRVAHVVDGRVVELVLGRVAHVRRHRVLVALAVLADHDTDQKNGLDILGVRRAVEGIGGVGRVAREVDALAI